MRPRQLVHPLAEFRRLVRLLTIEHDAAPTAERLLWHLRELYREIPDLALTNADVREAFQASEVRLREVRADLWGSSAELLAKAMDQGQIDAELTSVDRERLVDFLVRAGYLDSDSLVYTPPNSRGSAEPYDLGRLLESGFGNRAAILYAGTGGPDPVFQPIGGMMQIPLAFQRVLGDTITLNAEVRTVRQSPRWCPHLVCRDEDR